MNNYEVILIFHPGNSNLVAKLVEKYVSIIKKYNGKIYRLENWGRRHLSYPIKKFHKGHYVLLNVKVYKKTINMLSNKIRFDENILRNLIISVNKSISEKSPMMLVKDFEKKIKKNK
ncbi:30S ribosomal protein S6 [Buchnera aphidicola]|uniref:30S ribosomal protein S6 n=1 Tax=Buchnera aphidicola TaxID=9 RepID=UPI0031B890FA